MHMSHRRGLGDCFVGLVFFMEASTPFVAARGILNLLGMKGSPLYSANYLTMTMLFFLTRIVGIPALYWLYSKQKGLSVLEVIRGLKWHCNAGSVGIVAFQTIWFQQMLRGCLRIFRKKN